MGFRMLSTVTPNGKRNLRQRMLGNAVEEIRRPRSASVRAIMEKSGRRFVVRFDMAVSKNNPRDKQKRTIFS